MSRSRNLPNKRTKKNQIRIENIIVKLCLNYCTQASFQLFSMKWVASVLYSICESYTNIRGGNQWNFGVSKQFCGWNRNGPRPHLDPWFSWSPKIWRPGNLVCEKFGIHKSWGLLCVHSKTAKKWGKKVANYQKFICIKVTSYKTHILVRFGKIKKCWPPKK